MVSFSVKISKISGVNDWWIIFLGESVEENANLVIRLLIRRPECLGPALRGEGEGLLRAIIDANKMSERIADRRQVRSIHIVTFSFHVAG